MSRAVARSERVPLDAYYTPDPLARALVSVLSIEPGAHVVEPSVGGGAFVRALRAFVPGVRVVGLDIDPDAPGLAECDAHRVGDWPAWAPSLARPEWVVGNPPYSHAQQHIGAALAVAPRVAMLLRLAMLESSKRLDWWAGEAGERLEAVYVLAERPSFTRGGTDSAAYGWFVWGPGGADRPRLRWLSWRDGLRVLG